MININLSKCNYYFNLFFEKSCLIYLTLFDIISSAKSFAYCQSFLVPLLLYYGAGYLRFYNPDKYETYRFWHRRFYFQIGFRHSEFIIALFSIYKHISIKSRCMLFFLRFSLIWKGFRSSQWKTLFLTLLPHDCMTVLPNYTYFIIV